MDLSVLEDHSLEEPQESVSGEAAQAGDTPPAPPANSLAPHSTSGATLSEQK